MEWNVTRQDEELNWSHIFDGIIKRENIDDHWSTNNLLKYQLSKFISREKWDLVWRFLHVNNTEIIKNSVKIKNLIRMIVN